MKKKMVCIVSVLILAAALTLSLTACNKGGKKDNGNISRSTESYYAGESETFAVSVETGKREKNFIADGVATDVQGFAEITVIPLIKNEFTEITFELAAEDRTLSGTLSAGNNGEFSSEINLDFKPATVTVKAADSASVIELGNVIENALTTDDIINIAKTEFADRIAAESADGTLNREIYVKLITGDRVNYYYYVSFIGSGVDYWAMLVEPETGKIVSKR